MQLKKSQTTGRRLLLAIPTRFAGGSLILAGCLAGCLLYSCGKRADTTEKPTVTRSANTPMEQVAKLLQGEKRSGSLIGAEDGDRLALSYNEGRQYILVDKLPGTQNIGLFSATSAELITSEYGIVIKDLSNDRLVLLANNDAESIRRMEQARSIMNGEGGSLVFGTIYGTTIVHPG